MEKQHLPEEIKGERVTLRKFTLDLAQKMYDYVDEDRERLQRFLPWPENIKSVDDEVEFIKTSIEKWDNHEASGYAIFRNSDDEYMGNITSFGYRWDFGSCEIGYWILGKFEGKGYMTESVVLLEKVLFDMGFNRLVIRFDPENNRSGSIPRRLNYFHEGTLREVLKVEDEFRNLEVYSKLKREWLNQK